MIENSYFGLLRVCCETALLKETNHTSRFQGVKNAFSIEWERKVGYKPCHSLEKLVSHGFHTRILKPDGNEFQNGGFTWVSHEIIFKIIP